MARGFSTGLYTAPVRTTGPVTLCSQVRPSKIEPMAQNLQIESCKKEEFLLLLVLFILLAASPSLGIDGKYFFIIIMAIIGLGGFEKAFGLLLT
ncbi:MAG: hypothetical protein ACM3TR_11210 [Caulobacteraceae bacterium]